MADSWTDSFAQAFADPAAPPGAGGSARARAGAALVPGVALAQLSVVESAVMSLPGLRTLVMRGEPPFRLPVRLFVRLPHPRPMLHLAAAAPGLGFSTLRLLLRRRRPAARSGSAVHVWRHIRRAQAGAQFAAHRSAASLWRPLSARPAARAAAPRRSQLRIGSRLTAYLYLVDGQRRVRWEAVGFATAPEMDALLRRALP